MHFSFFSGTYSNLCIPSWTVAIVTARFVLCSCRCVSIKAELTKLAWYKALLKQGPNLDAFSNDTKEWWAQSATAGWLGVAEKLSSSLKHLLHSMSQIMPVAYNHTFNHSSSPEEDLPKAIKRVFFFFFFKPRHSLEVYLAKPKAHKKQRHALQAQECVWTTVTTGTAYADYHCWYL